MHLVSYQNNRRTTFPVPADMIHRTRRSIHASLLSLHNNNVSVNSVGFRILSLMKKKIHAGSCSLLLNPNSELFSRVLSVWRVCVIMLSHPAAQAHCWVACVRFPQTFFFFFLAGTTGSHQTDGLGFEELSVPNYRRLICLAWHHESVRTSVLGALVRLSGKVTWSLHEAV